MYNYTVIIIYNCNYRQDFVDVTLACADGSTLEAHKVVLSSVSSYFRDILKVSTVTNSGNDSKPTTPRSYPGLPSLSICIHPTSLHRE